MSKVAGYILKLTDDRYSSLRWNLYNKFVEPVPDFNHSRNIPLICFITNQSGNITHIGMASRGLRAGTDLSKLNIEEIHKLQNVISATKIADNAHPNVKYNITLKVISGGLLSKKSFEEFLAIFLREAPETVSILGKFTRERRQRIEKLTPSARKSLAEQQEAVLTAMNIAGIDRNQALGWDYTETEKPISFLDGINCIRLREDSMIVNDLNNMPGYNLIKSTKFSSSVFENEETRLTVLLANRLPLEELLGTDLIYFNENFKCFVMVQYKVMEKESNDYRFRLPNKQLSEEISRMDSILTQIKKINRNDKIDHYRINEDPFFIKICPRLEFDPDNVGLSNGMYIPLDYIKMLEKDKCIEGKWGGKAITYENVGRYFDNTAFKTIVEGGWIGTNPNQSLLVEKIIKDILENKKTVVIAMKKDNMTKRYSNKRFRK